MMTDEDLQPLRLVKFIDRRAHDSDVELRDGIIVRVTRLGLQTRLELRIDAQLAMKLRAAEAKAPKLAQRNVDESAGSPLDLRR